jgi:periplasmic glucans biosynthesis protein
MLAGATTLAAAAAAGFSEPALAQQGLRLGAAAPFSFEALKTRARDMAARAYTPPPRPRPDVLERIDYDAHGKIRFKTDLALWATGPSPWPVTFFHLGRFFQKPVRMHVVDGADNRQTAREIIYDERYFDMPADSPAHQLPENSGFAGFRFQETRSGFPGPKGAPLDWRGNDWVAFLGASYFRAIGELYQYGLSARGLAIDPAVPTGPEEFPDFTHIYLLTPAPDAQAVTVVALMDSPSVAGAFRFVMRRDKAVIMDIEKSLYIRKDINRFGVAPLTSMYWYSENKKATAVDWRPEVHDSDGLSIWTGGGERAWRPLNNPPRTIASSFVDNNPRGFGLMQRDRVFANYMDGVFYEKRPSLWIEPVGEWGRGAVQLIEIPTDDEIHDNIVAMWVPEQPVRAGQNLNYRYRMFWMADEPYPAPLARVAATRMGNGGQPGTTRPRGVRKFMVEFLGDTLRNVPFGQKPEVVLWASRGTFSYVFSEAIPNDVPGHWRAQFDLSAEGDDPVEMRCFLRLGDRVLSETWMYQYHPFA